MNNPVIIVIAFNREKSLQRLLQSLTKAHYPKENITLHISIDGSNNLKVKALAEQFEWKFGEKVIDLKNENLGLYKHVLECGELTGKYGEIIVLEDDLVVAPGFYQYAVNAQKFYTDDDRIAGISLFTYPVEENNFYPFQPVIDDSDVHFIQVASSWGQSWNAQQWSGFKKWLIENPKGNEAILPEYILNWGNNSWKKHFINYMIDTDRYFVFPNTAYSTNFEEVGTHATQTGYFQVPLNLGFSKPRFKPLKESNSVYDVYFELTSNVAKRILPWISDYNFDVDLYGKKPIDIFEKEYVLTIRNGVKPVRSYGASMQPLIQNVIFENEGNDIVLIKKTNLNRVDDSYRFLELSESIERLRQNSNAFTSFLHQVTIVLPAINEERFNQTIAQLYKERFHNVTILVICSSEFANKFIHVEDIIGCRLKWAFSESENLNELLRVGFNHVDTEYMSWAQAGMGIDLKKFEKVAKVFSGMKQVNFLRGVDEEINEDNYLTKSSASWRLTPQMAYLYTNRSRNLTSELMVWRKSLFDEINQELKADFSNLFIELLKATPMYVFMEKLGDTKGMESIHTISKPALRECLSEPRFKRTIFQRILTHPFLFPGFYCNFPLIRFFYKELAKLPLVIRYDYKNDSYFLDNY